ncbi:MAG: hypothetical protein C0443_07260 [Comamonadaceae bacterium]|nr:hypothetical protein [Comamonadaceae bacterium]
MRHWLLILMIALLPLRGWAGDAMAMSMWAAPPAHQTASPCHGGPATLAAQEMAHDGHHTADTPSHNSCTACDICNGPAMTLAAHSARTTLPAVTTTAPACERFASAVPQRGSKPPIA